MSWFKNLKISSKVLSGYILVGIIAVIAGHISAGQSPSLTAVVGIIAALVTVGLAITISRLITKPLDNLITAAEQMAQGDLNIKLAAVSQDEIGKLTGSIARVVENLNALVEDEKMLVQAAVEGKVDTRADASKHNGEFRTIVEGMNATLDSIMKPLSECIGVLKKLALNDYTSKVEGQYEGIFEQTAHEVNRLRKLLLRVIEVNTNISTGEFAHDLEILKKTGKYSEADIVIPSYIMCMENIQRLVDDARMMADAAVAGKLDARIDITQHQGEYRRVVEGINATLDTIADKAAWYEAILDSVPFPVDVIDNDMNWIFMNKTYEKLMVDQGVYKDRQSGVGMPCCSAGANICNSENCGIKQLLKGNPEVLFEYGDMRYKQDTAFLKNRKGENIGFVEIVTDLTSIIRVNDYTQAEVERIEKNLQMLANGNFEFNMQLKEADQYTTEVNAQFARINSSLQQVEEAIGNLVDDAVMLSSAAVEGKLAIRADASRHKGKYRDVVDGINNTLDAVVGPLNMAAEYIERIAQGNTPPKITDNYNGDFNVIKNDLNTCIDLISTLVEEVGVVIEAGVEGKLDHRANAERTHGVWRKILTGVNESLDAVIAPINETAGVLDELAKGRLNVNVTGNYRGDYARIKDALNTTINTLHSLIAEQSETLGQLAQGNLDITMEKDYKGDYEPISSAIKNIISTMNEVMGHINQAAEQVAGGSEQIADSSQALAQGASEQASAIEQLTSAVTEIAAQTKQNASKANQANELALNARDDATRGNKQMKEMLNAMEDINDSSTSISKIIKVIDEIAFQTNILALNAAVEAARAGQHGKGFAVVAEEVRNLAARSASAAKETTDLIEGSIRKVQSGTQIANETAQALNKIVDGISQAAGLVGDIAVASNEQATGIAQIDQGIVQVSQVVQNNSATAQQSAAASEELSEQAGLLKGDVAKFRLKQQYTKFQGNSGEALQSRNRPETKFNPGIKEAAASGSGKRKIVLDGDFGKY